MARPAKKIVEEVVEESTKVTVDTEYIVDLLDMLRDVRDRVLVLEKICIKPEGKLINKVEKFNNEVPTPIEDYDGMKMDTSDKIQSMRNAIKILPPNMVVDGRHLKENIEAICGFKVLDEMLDAAYEGI